MISAVLVAADRSRDKSLVVADEEPLEENLNRLRMEDGARNVDDAIHMLRWELYTNTLVVWFFVTDDLWELDCYCPGIYILFPWE